MNRRIAVAATILVGVLAFAASFQNEVHLGVNVHTSLAVAVLTALCVDLSTVAGSAVVLAGVSAGWVAIAFGVVTSVAMNGLSASQNGPVAVAYAVVPSVSYALATFVSDALIRRFSRTEVRVVNGATQVLPKQSLMPKLAWPEIPTLTAIRSAERVSWPRAREIRALMEQAAA